jgi:hypothetical protein
MVGNWITFVVGRIFFMIGTEMLLICVIVTIVNMFYATGLNYPLGISCIIPSTSLLLCELFTHKFCGGTKEKPTVGFALMFGLILQFSCLPFLFTMLILDRDSDFVNEVFERELIISKRQQINEPLLSVSGEEEESEQVNK